MKGMVMAASPCYCRGTLILTEEGELPVEDLGIGHHVITVSGEVRPIKWIWRRSYDGRLITGNRALLPVRLADSSLGDAIPSGDLLVSPEDHIYIDNVFVQARYLVNGATITQLETIERVEYTYIELETHDVILAQGTPVETFASSGRMFPNYRDYLLWYPRDDRRYFPRYAHYLHSNAPKLTEIRVALLRRAEALGYGLDTNADLHVIADGKIIRPSAVIGRMYRFLIPSDHGELWLASRSTVGADLIPAARDVRRLGVPVEWIVLCDDVLSITKQHDDPALRDGFYKDEASSRWTNGRGRLPTAWLRAFARAFTLEVHLGPSELSYLTARNNRIRTEAGSATRWSVAPVERSARELP